ncbi:alpha/beta-hydrolase [Guyanagaster necrorhizus]|uniref:Alpha/beta-hydrolase n=1 Tax=Guyanagaster necrorhizus TaxID=856835 RepID=A0A9P7VYA8_9AGAR|nr:alpha/beta-hydrolase [Guyanagaster necrorhizus MCA 3950]KAG7448797.1 alpha/beta-hydrolase [Guyanagaster necrorhizus MCA 3950]
MVGSDCYCSHRPETLTNVKCRKVRLRESDYHILESVEPLSDAPLVILLHGFPELAYSWRKVIQPLSQAGYHVVAPDQWGYGRMAVTPIQYDDNLEPFQMSHLVQDVVTLIRILGYSTASVVGHDFGSLVAGFCALTHPDIFQSVVFMSAPFTGLIAPDAPLFPTKAADEILSLMNPPRKYYTTYFSSRDANKHLMQSLPLETFLRAYFRAKAADGTRLDNSDPHPLASIDEMEKLPRYYVMLQHETMPDAVLRSQDMPDISWLTPSELSTYAYEYSRTGFQGGLNWYRCSTDAQWTRDLSEFAGKGVEVPAMFIAGKLDWGTYQAPGALVRMKSEVCGKMEESDVILIEDAGHWVQQEKSEAVVTELVQFLDKCLGR